VLLCEKDQICGSSSASFSADFGPPENEGVAILRSALADAGVGTEIRTCVARMYVCTVVCDWKRGVHKMTKDGGAGTYEKVLEFC